MLQRTFTKYGFCAAVAAALWLPASSSAETTGVALERARGERLATAVGHFARARSLLIAAVREFDKGNKLVDPAALLDAHEWRNSLIDRAEDLEKILDPQPRANRSGVTFSPDPRLIGVSTEAPGEK